MQGIQLTNNLTQTEALVHVIYQVFISFQVLLLVAFIFGQLYESFYSPPHLPFFFVAVFVGMVLLLLLYTFFLFSLDKRFDTFNWYLMVSKSHAENETIKTLSEGVTFYFFWNRKQAKFLCQCFLEIIFLGRLLSVSTILFFIQSSIPQMW